jgi:PAS domain S-box-containing protein
MVRFFVETRPVERTSPPAGAGWSRQREEDARSAIEGAVRAGASVVLRAHERDASARGLGAVVAVPLVVDGHPTGAIAIAFGDSHRASPADVELISAFGAECALLLDRCRVLETEAALRARAEASEALFRLVAEHAPDLVFRFRLTPVPGFDYMSPSALELTGHRPEEFYADPTLVLALLHVEDRGRLARLGDGSGDPVELRWWRRDGGMCWSEVRSACVLDANGRIVALEGIARDVTSRKRREIERESAYALEHEARARAESAARAREDLLAMVSHDLRTPLNTVTLGARMAIEALARGDDPESLERRLGSIRHAAERMGRLVAQLLDAASIEAGRFSLTPEHVDAEALAREALDLVAASAADKRVELRSEVGPVGAVACDRERVLQVLANLLGNAIKFTPSGGRVELRVETDAAWASFSVCDTGPGIPEQQLPLIFDRYWTGRLQRTAGTGLGLFIAKGIVEAHTGRLVVDSRVGVGSTFTFTLPRLPR